MKTVTVVCRGNTTLKVFTDQLSALLGHQTAIRGYSCEENVPETLEGEVVLLSGHPVAEMVLPRVKDESRVVIARRSVNYHEVARLFSIPAGSEALLVNDMASSARAVIAMLRTLGVDHINYFPYYPGCGDYPQLPLAVTPGEGHLVPDCVREVVDIKTRVIDITTIVDVLTRLDLMDAYGDMLSARHVRDILSLFRDNAKIMRKGARLQSQLQAVINTVHDGIVGTDENGRISVFNPVAEEMLGVRAGAVLGRDVTAVEELDFLHREKPRDSPEELHKIGGRRIVTNVTGVEYADGRNGNVYSLKDVSEIRRLEESVRRKLKDENTLARYTFANFAGTGKAVRASLETAARIARSEAAILLEGETGTGKELIAHGIHNESSRRNGPFIAVNFSAITESLLESELFGYEPGAFTGAMKGGRIGLFEAAHKGTVFLDEIGDAPLAFQIRLLRVLQEREIKRVGSFRVIPVDFRVIAATNRNLKDLVAQGLFRRDLYYRLNVLPLRLPPLRERREEMGFLAGHVYRNLTGKDPGAFFDAVLPAMRIHSWPGNFRELQNLVEYLVHVCPGQPPTAAHLPEEMRRYGLPRADADAGLVYDHIVRAKRGNERPGRRSLAECTGLPESRIRAALALLASEGKIRVGKGRQGIVPK